jgi:hypothetical protein
LNWKELSNLVDSLDEILTNNDLRGCEMFMFTDNSTAEAVYWKGTSHSQKLFELVLRLKKLEAKHDMILHVIHVSGKRMIAQGTDGISWGDHSAGVMRGIPMTAYVPLHQDAFAREPKLVEFIREISSPLAPKFLEPEGWFEEGHKSGNFIWSPAPAAAKVVVEQLGRARLKRPQSLHIIVVPRLMTGRWQRHLSRGTDFYLKIDWDNLWPLATHHEPVLMFVCLPYISHRPNLAESMSYWIGFEGLWAAQGVTVRNFFEGETGFSAQTSCRLEGTMLPVRGRGVGSALFHEGTNLFPFRRNTMTMEISSKNQEVNRSLWLLEQGTIWSHPSSVMNATFKISWEETPTCSPLQIKRCWST